MKKLTEQQLIIVAYQLATFLGFGTEGYKSRGKSLSILRSQIGKLTASILDAPSSNALAVLDSLVNSIVREVVTGYPDSKSVLKALRALGVPVISAAGPEKFWRTLGTLIQDMSKAVNGAMVLPPAGPDADPALETSRRKAAPALARAKRFEDQGKMLGLVASVANNSLWVTTLNVLMNGGAKWATADVPAIQDELYKKSSSPQGRAQLSEKLALLWPNTKKPSWKVDDAMLVQVSLDPVALYQHPDLQKLLEHPLSGVDGKVPMSEVIATLSAPVPAGADPMDVAKQLVADIVSLAKKRLRSLDAEKRTRADAASKKAEQQLVEQLRGLPEPLRNALKKNPDLLNKV
ncbi:hypothetical protein LMG26857_03798 [Achromobacter anxifer]|uniref:hypothetical protein n=1 Tax=Achromobacter anxifer TaxID=1287737 RepID=UPI00155C8538|nr:hypothetical protein [Achromobacter anxifer]CAB5514739.1 hypothetical protein LMG26857_03798 [Achromobacter anxifer]